MMGKRGHTGGDDYEAFTRGLRRKLSWGRGEIKKMKRVFSKRVRKAARLSARKEGQASQD